MSSEDLLPWLMIALVLITGIGTFLCSLWILAIAFGEGAMHGLGCLFCGPYGFYFCIAHWEQCKMPFSIALVLSIGSIAAQSQLDGEGNNPVDRVRASVERLQESHRTSQAEWIRRDLQRLQGKWMLSFRMDEPVPQYEVFEFDGDQCVVTGRGDRHRFQVELARSSVRRTIDLKNKSQMLAGVYLLNGDELTLCIAGPGHPRPSRFVSWGDRQRMFVLKRGSSQPEEATAAGSTSTEANSMTPTASSKQST